MQTPQDEVREIIDQVLRLTQCFAILWEIVRREHVALYPELREKHLPFFEPVQFLLAECFFVICYQLFDHRTDSKHIRGLIESVKDSGIARGCNSKITAHDATIQKIIKIRHKVFAHREKGVNPFDTFKNEGLTIKEMRETVELAQDVVSELSDALGVRSKSDQMREFASFQKTAKTGCVQLFDSLHRP